MSIISFEFLFFILALLIIYYTVPKKRQWIVLLIGSLFFYMYSNPIYVVFILVSVLSTFYLMQKPEKWRFLATVFINLAILIVFRYSIYFGVKSLIIPLGISFYTFMTLGYAHDVYGKKIEPEKNLFHYALFITYFPQITEGPIGTYKDMQKQLITPHDYDLRNIKYGGYRVIKGLFKKLVIAGRLTYYVDTVFEDVNSYGGLTLLMGVFFYALELYADFSGYMDIAAGISEMLGIKLTENFIRPYFSRNIQEYWRRWHISLNEWFKDHLMLPAVTSGWNRKASKFLGKIFRKAKKGNLRTVLPLILVWIITGIWHGAETVYIGWGVYFSIIMLISVLSMSYVKKLKQKLKWNSDNIFIIIFTTLRTFIIVLLGEVMFRAETMKDALTIYRKIFTDLSLSKASIMSALTPFGNGNQAAASVMIIVILIIGLFIVELTKEINENAFVKHKYLYAGLMLICIGLFGIFGQSNFMYQAF